MKKLIKAFSVFALMAMLSGCIVAPGHHDRGWHGGGHGGWHSGGHGGHHGGGGHHHGR